MKILITGFIALVIWSFFSMWLYVDILKPATKKQEVTQPVSESRDRAADSLAKLEASRPDDLVIYFDFDKSNFTPDAQSDAKVEEIKTWLGKYQQSVLSVTGHTDFIGTPEYNTELGMKRAQAAGTYLEQKGIPAGRMSVSSRGEEEPVADLFTSEGRAKNRRAVITIK